MARRPEQRSPGGDRLLPCRPRSRAVRSLLCSSRLLGQAEPGATGLLMLTLGWVLVARRVVPRARIVALREHARACIERLVAGAALAGRHAQDLAHALGLALAHGIVEHG